MNFKALNSSIEVPLRVSALGSKASVGDLRFGLFEVCCFCGGSQGRAGRSSLRLSYWVSKAASLWFEM